MTDKDDQDAALASYLKLATLADRQMPRLGFFPPPDPLPGEGAEAQNTAGPQNTTADPQNTAAGPQNIAAPPDGPGPQHPAGLQDSGIQNPGTRDEIDARIVADPGAWFTAERRGLLEITRWACANGEYLTAARLASRQLTFQYLQHRVDDADQMWRAVEQAAERAGDIATSSEARFHLAWVMADAGRFTDAYAALDKCIPILEARGVLGTLAVALYWRAFCADMLGLAEVQRDDGERCLGLARRLREPGIEVMALRILGMALIRLGSVDRGIELCEQAVRLAQEKGQLAWEFYAITTLAFALCKAGRHDSAESCCQRGIEVSSRLGLFATGEAYLLGFLGDAYMGQGRYRDAVASYAQARREFNERGELRGEALCLLKLGQAHIALGEPGQAAEVLQQCFPMFIELGLPAYEDEVLKVLAQCRTTAEATLAGTA